MNQPQKLYQYIVDEQLSQKYSKDCYKELKAWLDWFDKIMFHNIQYTFYCDIYVVDISLKLLKDLMCQEDEDTPLLTLLGPKERTTEL